MPFDAGGTFTALRNWEADYAADQLLGAAKIGISPVRMDQQDADIAAGLTALKASVTLLGTTANLATVLTALFASLPTADPQILNAPWNNGNVLTFSKGP